jgi:hypothetical protein
MSQPGTAQNAARNPGGSQSAQQSSTGANATQNDLLPPLLVPPLPLVPQQDHGQSLGLTSPMSPGMMGPSSMIAHPNVAASRQIPRQPVIPGQPSLDSAMGPSFGPTQFGAYSGQGQQPQIAPRSSLAASLQSGRPADPPPPRTAPIPTDPGIQTFVNSTLQSSLLRGLTVPFYPAPPDIAPINQQSQGDEFYQSTLTDLGTRLHQWTQIFDGEAMKPLTLESANFIVGCLDVFSPIDPGLVALFSTGRLTIEGLYHTPSFRRLIAEHILALNLHLFVFVPFYPGIESNVDKLLAGITDQLFRNRMSPFWGCIINDAAPTMSLDCDWRQSACRHLSGQISKDSPIIQAFPRLSPVLNALYPHVTGIPRAQLDRLIAILQEIVNVFRSLRVEKDVYAPFFPVQGSEMTNFNVCHSRHNGPVFLCLFPGLMKRYWDEISQSWFEKLMMPAVVELEGVMRY